MKAKMAMLKTITSRHYEGHGRFRPDAGNALVGFYPDNDAFAAGLSEPYVLDIVPEDPDSTLTTAPPDSYRIVMVVNMI